MLGGRRLGDAMLLPCLWMRDGYSRRYMDPGHTPRMRLDRLTVRSVLSSAYAKGSILCLGAGARC